MMLVILGDIDISVGSIIALCGVSMGMLYNRARLWR